MLNPNTATRLARQRIQEDWDHHHTSNSYSWGAVYAASRGAIARSLVTRALTRAHHTPTRIERYLPEHGRSRGFLVTGDEHAVRITMHPQPMTPAEQHAISRAVAFNGQQSSWRITWDHTPQQRAVIVRPGTFDWAGATTTPISPQPSQLVLPEQCDHPRGYLAAVAGRHHHTHDADARHHSTTYVQILAGWSLERDAHILKYPGGLVTMTDPNRPAAWFYWPAPAHQTARECTTCGHFRSEHGSTLYDDACRTFQPTPTP